jgi:hypothetical protein
MKTEYKENEDKLLDNLLGKRVTFFCCRYIYTGDFISYDDDTILLKNGGIVYETGSFDTKEWKDYQELPNDVYISRQSIESFGIIK